MKYVSFLWPPVLAAQDLRGLYEYCIAAEVICSRIIIIPRIQLRPSDPNFRLKICRTLLPVKIAFTKTISKPQSQVLIRAGIYSPYPVFYRGSFRRLRNVAKSDYYLHVGLSKRDSFAPTGRIFIKCYI
jgi:hypothetical protein